MTPEENNLLMRRVLRNSSPKIITPLPTVTGSMGGTTRVRLQNTGIITRLFLDIQIPYNASVAPNAIGNKSVYAAVPRLQLLDFDGSSRHNISAFLLAIRNGMRGEGIPGGAANLRSLASFTSVAPGNSNAFRMPQISLGTGAQTLRMFLEVPVAADVNAGDLRGALLAQFTSGELQLAIDFASSLNGTANDDCVFNGGTMSVGSPTVTVYQEYYLPQKVRGVVPIPQDDISTVYALDVYSRTNDNFSASQEKILNFPTVRSINAVYMNYMTNSLLGGGSAANDLQRFRIVANSATTLYNVDHYGQQALQRNRFSGNDLPQGVFALDFADGPISTAIYSNVQLFVTPGAVLTSPNIEIVFESFYPKGAALSGIPQA